MDLMGCDKVMNGDTLGMLLVVEAFLFSFLCVCVSFYSPADGR